ncbi:hypothetical protein KAU33_09725, partial [Candidatus Dependentiae bacterium]|nr:hypothetical protein [Candidatus Dependentiae bacterium]
PLYDRRPAEEIFLYFCFSFLLLFYILLSNGCFISSAQGARPVAPTALSYINTKTLSSLIMHQSKLDWC